jgi:uncharacterized protein YfaS (alpha-2-macroglobulin family)
MREGKAAIAYSVPSEYANAGLLQANFYTTVFDETGRPVSRTTSAEIFTQDIFHGIRSDGSYYYALNQPITFHLVSVNREGAAVNTSANVKVIKHEYKTVLVKSGNYFRYESQQADKVMTEKTVNVSNGTVFNFVPRSPATMKFVFIAPVQTPMSATVFTAMAPGVALIIHLK